MIKVEKDSFFPADLLLLSSTNDDGIAYVETVNLDGESNLKIKKALDQTKGLTSNNIAAFKVPAAAQFHTWQEHKRVITRLRHMQQDQWKSYRHCQKTCQADMQAEVQKPRISRYDCLHARLFEGCVEG